MQMGNIIVIIIVLIMLAAGILGAMARHIMDRHNLAVAGTGVPETKWREIAIPGIVAAFIVPLFLSISGSNILSKALDGVELAHNSFILFGFCLLAAYTARNFLDSIAAKALQTANEAAERATEAKVAAQSATDAAKTAATAAEEVKDIVSEEGVKVATAMAAEGARSSRDAIIGRGKSNEERAIIAALIDGDLSKRSVTGLARDSGLSKSEVREVLAELVRKKIVVEVKSLKTGSLLYQLTLDDDTKD